MSKVELNQPVPDFELADFRGRETRGSHLFRHITCCFKCEKPGQPPFFPGRKNGWQSLVFPYFCRFCSRHLQARGGFGRLDPKWLEVRERTSK